MSGIYIHIPFCSQKCAYCDFYSISDFSLKNRYVQALKKEIKFRASYLDSTDIQSLYIGGGTPSMLSASDIEQITNYIDKFFSLSPQAEITLEANPNNLTNSYLSELKTTAINRLSIG
ncbi:MAG: radical SAM protein, partial [Bacteroidales bacterium]|nr:radical SAM protein [Bacteroidales bacterium]